VEKYYNPMVVEEQFVALVTQTAKHILKYLFSVINDGRKELSGNSQTEI
jgi:hypothetical protein